MVVIDNLNKNIKRRTFVKSALAVSAGLGGLGSARKLLKITTAEAAEIASKKGEWVVAPCWSNCGGRCVNQAYVVDGVVTRQKTDDTHPDSWDYPQQRGCGRGRSRRKQIFGADRLKYPMRRKNWSPGGGRKELRGEDEWERISWDEALDTVAAEIKKTRNKYGNESVLCIDWGPDYSNLLNATGGYVSTWGTSSYGGWYFGGPKFGMADGFNGNTTNDRYDFLNTDLFVIVGANPANTGLGFPSNIYLKAKEAGAKFIFIDPYYTDSAAMLADEWIPIKPTTDHALFLGMAHTLLEEDNPKTNPLIDWEFLNKCTVGFDADHMPSGANPKDNFKDYVLGLVDGKPKSAEWASELCGVEAHVIRRLARTIATTKKTALLCGWAPGRKSNGDSWPQMFMTLGAMAGHFGESGRMTGVCCDIKAANGGPALLIGGGTGRDGFNNPVQASLNDSERWDAILKGKYTAGENDVRPINIQAILYGWGGLSLQTNEGINKGIDVHKKVDFVCTFDSFFNTQAKYSDVVLPVATQWEKSPKFPWEMNREALLFPSQVVEPKFEIKDDRWICTQIAKRLGVKEKELYPLSEQQEVFNQLAGTQVMKEDCSGYEPLCTVTRKDLKKWGVEGNVQQGRIAIDSYAKQGIYQIPRKPGDQYGHIAFEDFRKDPKKHPLNTSSGKLEIHCQALVDMVKAAGFPTNIQPIPTYDPAIEGYESTFSDFNRREKGKYPLQLFTPHNLRTSHSTFNNVPWQREAFPNPVYINISDANQRGIKNGDTVAIEGAHGKTLRNACVTERMTPGVVALPHGLWVRKDKAADIDTGGADNVLCNTPPTGQGISGYNSINVQIAKWTGRQLREDWQQPPDIALKGEV